MTSKIILGAIVAIAFLLGTVTTGTMASAQTSQSNVPDWIKNNAGWWANGDIDDESFVKGIQWLIKEGIIQIQPTTQDSSGSTLEIPAWIRNNAGWWSQEQIDDETFLNGIEYLVNQGIMQVI